MDKTATVTILRTRSYVQQTFLLGIVFMKEVSQNLLNQQSGGYFIMTRMTRIVLFLGTLYLSIQGRVRSTSIVKQWKVW